MASHVNEAPDPNAPDLSDVTQIDTTRRTVTLASGSPPALRFDAIGGRAVLFVGAWDVNRDVRVRGVAPLVVVASRAVEIRARIDASARKNTSGPGGYAPAAGPGKGGNAVPSGTDDPGGGGAGFGTAGAKGADGITATGGAPGAAYGSLVTDFFGGSGGGNGSPYGVSPCTTEGSGGAGGGAIQITSLVSVRVQVGGVVEACGGGGRGGCLNGSNDTMSGGGGGSGGTIFLEAPSILVLGTLSANGGSGGGGAQASSLTAGQDGNDGTLTYTPAAGGIGATFDRHGGLGGARDAGPTQPIGGTNNSRGGGGAVGRIWLRTRGTTPNVDPAAIVTPAASFDTGL